MDEDKLYKIIDALMEKYKGNEYIKGRIGNYIENLLPVILENEAKVQKQREERKQELNNIRLEGLRKNYTESSNNANKKFDWTSKSYKNS